MRIQDIARPRLERIVTETASPDEVTAHMRMVELPVEFLLQYATKPDASVVRNFVEKAEAGEFGGSGPVVLTIDSEGNAEVTENPGRVFAAHELDIPSVAAEVRWLGNSQDEKSAVNPKDVTAVAVWG